MEPDDKTLKMHEVLTEMLFEFSNKCKEAKLEFYLFYGTMLGAVRHSGFIPWDDDVDLLMKRGDYNKFIELYKHDYSDNCYLDAWNCPEYHTYAPNLKICNRHVFYIQNRNGIHEKIPVFLSIWIIDGLPPEGIRRKIHIHRIFNSFRVLRLSRAAVNGTNDTIDRSLIERLLISVNNTLKIGRIISPRKAAQRFNKIASKYGFNSSHDCFIGWNPKGNRIFKCKWFDGYQQVEFEKEEFHIPIGYKEILSLEYGDYMSLPPIEKRKPEHSCDIFFE